MYNGILNIYKEKGYTSHDVVAKLRGILKQKKIGHTGTLDPNAEGVLPVCLGTATKLCDMLTEKDKIYEATMRLGYITDTQDSTGKIQRECPVTQKEAEIRNVIQSFIGEYLQIPPMYSAIKLNGKKLYELAREGKEVERKPRKVFIYKIEIISLEIPTIKFRVSCSKGTYIRTLCYDIGEKLGCGACMEELLRTKVGVFSIEDSITLSGTEQYRQTGQLEERILPVEEVLKEYSKCFVKADYQKLIYNGNPFCISQLDKKSRLDLENPVRVYDKDERFVGIFKYRKDKEKFYPVKMFL